MKCEFCGRESDPGDRFCLGCGHRFPAQPNVTEEVSGQEQNPYDIMGAPAMAPKPQANTAPMPYLTLVECYKRFWKNWLNMSGRATRREYWGAWLMNFIISMFIGLFGYYANIAYSCLILIPTACIFVRRMHDIGKSGWQFLWFFVPILGWAIVFINLVTPSKHNMP